MPLVKYHPPRQWRKALYSHLHPISCNCCEVTELGETVMLPGLDLSPSGNQKGMPGAATTTFICHLLRKSSPTEDSNQWQSPHPWGRGREIIGVSPAWNPLGCFYLLLHPAEKPPAGFQAPLWQYLSSQMGLTHPWTDSSMPLSLLRLLLFPVLLPGVAQASNLTAVSPDSSSAHGSFSLWPHNFICNK